MKQASLWFCESLNQLGILYPSGKFEFHLVDVRVGSLRSKINPTATIWMFMDSIWFHENHGLYALREIGFIKVDDL